MSRILLAQPSFNGGKRLPETPSRALLILGTLAKKMGHEVKIVHTDIEEVDWSWKPEIVGITVNTFQVKSARGLVKMAKNRNAKVIIGGPHTCVWDNKVDGNVDKIVIGEGENAWLEFIGAAPSLKDINDIPIPDYSLVDMDRFAGVEPIGMMPSTAIMASRGCPYQCTFCNTPLFWGNKVRFRDPLLIVDEIELLHNQYGVSEIFFQDDTFNINRKWSSGIFNELIKRGLNNEMMFKICCRADEKLVTRDFLELAREAGVWNIFFGIESGSQYMLDRMKKGITVPGIKAVVALTKEVGISAQCSFIIGLPGESLATLKQTETLLHIIKPSLYGYCFACPFPYTELDKEVTERKHKLETDFAEYSYGNIYCRTDALNFPELQSFAKRGFNYGG